jgi:MFS family permease
MKGLLWRCVYIVIAALAMVATLPGRTHGLGLITEPLLKDLHLDRQVYAAINLWATLAGAAFCLPCGWLIDRLGLRVMLVGVAALLGVVTIGMSGISAAGPVVLVLFGLVLLTRGFGQSALSVVSLALIGKTAGRRQGPAVAAYSFITAIGFMGAFWLVKRADEQWHADWRALWAGIGVAVLSFSLAGLLVRPAALGVEKKTAGPGGHGLTLFQALGTPTFWVFAVATSLYGMIAAGVSLFNQSILEERGFDRSVFLSITAIMPLIGLASNLTTGLIAWFWSLSRLLAVSMAVLAAALLVFPFVHTLFEVYAYAATMGVAGGMVTVLFFAVWGQAYGPAHLGKIQGAAQMMTVFASAAGPWLLAISKERTGSYVLFYQCAAVAALVLALAAWFTVLPRFRRDTNLPQDDLRQRAPVFRLHSEHVQTAASDQIQRDPV